MPADSRCDDRACDVRKTYKLVHRRRVPALGVGPLLRGRRRRAARSSRNAAQASRKDARDAVVAARKAFAGWSGATRVQPRPGALPRRRDARGPARAVRRRGRRGRGRRRARGRAASVDAAIDRWVWYAGWADKIAQVAGVANPVAGPYFNFSLPEPTGVVAVLAPQDSSLLGLRQRARAGRSSPATRRWSSPRERPAAARGLARRGARDLRRARRRRQRADRRTAELAPWLAEPSRRQRDRPDRRAPTPTRAELQRAAADNVKRVFAPGRRGLDRRARASTRLTAFLETKTVWHPIGV